MENSINSSYDIVIDALSFHKYAYIFKLIKCDKKSLILNPYLRAPNPKINPN